MKLVGRVIKGESLGFKTANLKINEPFALVDGVYLAKVFYQKEEHPALAIMGVRQDIEVYLLDFEGDLYGQILEVEILGKLRDLMKFEKQEDLLKQIEEDVEQARSILIREQAQTMRTITDKSQTANK